MIKYMGAKRRLLADRLGMILQEELPGTSRFVDLFTGSAVVAWHVARNYDVPVTAVDMQVYSSVLATAVLARMTPANGSIATRYLDRVSIEFAGELEKEQRTLKKLSDAAFVSWIDSVRRKGTRTNSTLRSLYGGYYLSPVQCDVLEASIASITSDIEHGVLIVASALLAASRCSASPGHTAQPLSPNLRSARWIRAAWSINPVDVMREGIARLSPLYSLRKGTAVIEDAVKFARSCTCEDLVFIDPPYSSVHYSRFYHVLETIATGWRGSVSGSGRYPPSSLRPQSQFSVRSKAADAMEELLDVLAERRAKLVITYPVHECSNGLSAAMIAKLGSKDFAISRHRFSSRFSTLGGDNDHRSARQDATEAVLVFKPKALLSRFSSKNAASLKTNGNASAGSK